MASDATQFTVHPALGGLDISSDPTILDPNFLTIADNLEYLEGGQRKKRLGSLQYSASSSTAGSFGNVMVSSSSNVRAIKDFWRYGASLTPVQQFVAVTGASIFRSTGNGSWTAVTVSSSFGSNSNLNTSIVIAQDYAVISDGVVQPVAYDMATTTLLVPTTGANWPIFEYAAYHISRLFVSGISTAPSNVNYMASGNIFDSTGTDTGTMSIDQGDGDRVIAISKTFYGSIYVFKGPQYGSVHQLSGNTPATFARAKVAHGAPLISPRALVSTPSDIFWMSEYGVHSLQTTVKFGNVEQAFLSLPIQKLFREGLIKRTDIKNSMGFWNPSRNIVGWIVTQEGVSGQGSRNWILVYNYALSDPKPGGKKFWSIWKIGYGLVSLDVLLNPVGATAWQQAHQGEPHLFYGSDQGLVYQADWATLADDLTAYTMKVQTPTITRWPAREPAPETQEKIVHGVVTYYNASAISGTAIMDVTIDQRQQNRSFSLATGGSDPLG
jgi:hypothetical protein